MVASAGSFYSAYRISFTEMDADIAAAKRRLLDLRAFAQQTIGGAGAAPAGAGGGAPAAQAAALGRLQGPQQQTADGALRLAAAEARLAAAMGEPTRAASILSTALAQNVGASNQATLAIQTQAARLNSGSTAFQQFGASAKSSILGVIGPAAALGTGISVLTAVVNQAEQAFQWKAELDATTASINAQLKGVRDASQVYAEAAAFGQEFKLTQLEQVQAIQGAIGIIRQSKAPIEDILGVLARMQILSPEQSLQEAAFALKALASGDTQSLVTRFEVSRDLANKMKQEIAGGADAVQVMSNFLNSLGVGMDALKAKTEGAAGAIKDAAIEQERLNKAFAGEQGGLGLTLIQAKTNLYKGLANALSENSNALYAAAKAQDEAYNAALRQGATESEAAAAGVEAHRAALARFTDINVAVAQGMDAATAATQQAIAASGQHVSSIQAEIDAAIAAEQAHRAGAAAQAAATLESVNATVQSQTLAAEQQLLYQAALQAATGMNVGGDAAGFLASQFNITTGQADQLIGRMQALAQLQNTLAVGRATRVIGSVGVGEFRDEERDKVKTEIEDFYNRLGSGARQFQSTQTSGTRRGAGGGTSSSARLSDQAKLNNQLLADQDRYEDQAEAQAREHADKLLDIQADFEQKSLAQQRANEVSKRQGRADFYDALTSSSKDLGEQESQALAASYEQAYARAQEIAQAGNQKLADDYLAMRQQQIQKEIEYQKARKQAADDGDAAEVARLDAIRKLQQEADAEKERQLLAGGDANVNARDAALAAEDERYAQQQDKAATAAEKAGQRKIDQAARNGQAIDAENEKLREQERIYARQGRPPGTGAGPDTTSAPPPSTGAPPPSAGAGAGASPGGDQAWRVFDSGVVDALNAQTAAMNGGFDRVVAGLDTLARRVDRVEAAVRSSNGATR